MTKANGIWLICPCGEEFYATPSGIARGKKYCSQSCYHRFTERPRNAERPNWKGDAVGYKSLHTWVRTNLGTPATCEDCGTTDGRIEWANVSHEYRRDVEDWKALCKRCHCKYDWTTCRRGHERTSENIWVDGKGYSHCRPCRNERLRMQRAGKRAEWDARRLATSSAIREKFGA